MNGFLAKMVEQLISKKKLIGWISAALIAIVGAGISMDPVEVKSAVCGTEQAK